MPLMMMVTDGAFQGQPWINILFFVSYVVGVAFGYPFILNYVYKGKLCKIFFIAFIVEFIAGIIPLIIYTVLYNGAKLLHIHIVDPLMAICLMVLMIGFAFVGIRLFGPYLQKIRKYELNNILTWVMFVVGVGHSVIDNCRLLFANSYTALVVSVATDAFFHFGLVYVFIAFIGFFLFFCILRKRLQLLQATKDRMMNWYDDIMQKGVEVVDIEMDMASVLREVMRKSSAQGRKESLQSYCEKLQASYEKMKGNLYCRDYMVDATLADCVKKCQVSGIDTQIHFQTYDRGELNELTICYIVTQCFEAVMETANGIKKEAANANVCFMAMNAKGMSVFEMAYTQGDGQKIEKRPFRQLERQLESTVLKKNGFIREKYHKEHVEVMISIS